MKAGTASMNLWHMEPGHHKEVCTWHDADHKAEVLGTTPNIFISQRWVAPPALKALWPSSTLEHGGGEYVNLYWTTGTPAQLQQDFDYLGKRLAAVGRMEPQKYIQSTFGGRFKPVSYHVRPGLSLSPEAVPGSPALTGLMVVVNELLDTPKRDDFARWHEAEHIPMILDTKLFLGAAKLMPDDPEKKNTSTTLYYTDQPDPQAAYAEFMTIAAGWRKDGHVYPEIDTVRKNVHGGMYINSMGHYQYYD